MSGKVLRFKIFQPTAHYRDPKCLQNDYINTLPLPTRTTIVGMLTYLCGKRLKSNIEVGVIGTHKHMDLEFSRGERIDFWDEYRKLKKKKEDNKVLLKGHYYDYYKAFLADNSILNYEVLKEVELSIFFTCDDEEEFEFVKSCINSPGRYMNLGRKEDFIMPSRKGVFAEEIQVDEVYSTDIREYMEHKLKIKNSYVRVSIRDNEKYREIINKGILMALPYKYKDLEADKNNRVMEYSHYIYVNDDGIFPVNMKVNVCCDEEFKEVFTWL